MYYTIPSEQRPVALTRCADIVLVPGTPKGRGVFATAKIDAGTIIDTSPVLLLGIVENQEHVEKTALYNYTYNWPIQGGNDKHFKSQAVVFGLGSMFNHSRNQNVGWTRDVENLIITYKALRVIEAGEELCISYGDHLTFEDVDAKIQSSDEIQEDEISMLHNIQL